MLYTRKGDGGTSQLFGDDTRIPKDSAIFDALGTLDELNALLGVCFAKAERQGDTKSISIEKEIRAIQEDLFILQARLAGADKALSKKRITAVEARIDAIEHLVPPPGGFIIAGASELSALLDLARAVSRRAERACIAAQDACDMGTESYTYLNRLSSLLYALARYAAHLAHDAEKHPSY